MKNTERQVFLWSTDPEDKTKVVVDKPKNPPPYCGDKIAEFFFPTGEKAKAFRRCCVCGKVRFCSFSEAVNGVCPNCGAGGLTGEGGKKVDGLRVNSVVMWILNFIDRHKG